MNDQKLKSLDEFIVESEQFESQFEQLPSGDASAHADLIARIGDWLQDCAGQGRFVPSASPNRRAIRSLLGSWNSRLRARGHFIEGIDSLAEFDPDAGIVLKADCPYPGLEPYTQDQQSNFFGREALVAKSVQHFEQQGNRILLVIGASGSGKSSVALAGVLPRLKELHDGAWLFGELTPGTHPLTALAASAAEALDRPDQAHEIERSLKEKPGSALGQFAEWCGGNPLMLLIDQFEELFTLCRDEDERNAFAQILCSLSDPAVALNGFSCRILLTLRTDHLKRLEDHNTLKKLHIRLSEEKNHFWLSHIDHGDIKRAIKMPADEVGLRFVPESLIDRLANQTVALSNGLPLLQFSLRRLWDTRPKDVAGEPLDMVTQEMVEGLPDVAGALGKVANNIFETFNFSQQKICERLMLELLVLDENFEEPLRRRRNEQELKHVLPKALSSPPDPGDVDRVIDEFVRVRLLRRFGNRSNGQLEVAHEALLRHWPHIYQLLTGAEAKERLHLVKQIGKQAGDWASRGKSGDYLLLKGERLHRAMELASDGWLAEAEAEAYVEACKTQEEAVKVRDDEAKRSRRFMWYAVGLAAVSIVASLAYYISSRFGEMKRITEANKLMSYGFYLLHTNNPISEEKFKQAVKLNRDDLPLAKLALGLFSLSNDNYQQANAYFSNLIEYSERTGEREKDPLLYTYYYYYGKSFRGLLDYQNAALAFRKAIKLVEDNKVLGKDIPDYYYNLGLSDLSLNHIADAEDNFKKGLSSGVDTMGANAFGLGRVYLGQKNFDAAKAKFEQAKSQVLAERNAAYPFLPDYYYHLGLSYFRCGDMQAAEKAFKDGLSLGGSMEAANRDGLGQVYLRTRNFQAASDEFAEAIELSNGEAIELLKRGAIELSERKHSELVSYRLHLAQACLSLEQYERAAEVCRVVISDPNLNPEDEAKAYTLFGNSLTGLNGVNEPREAIDAFQKAYERNQGDAFVALYLSDAYMKKHDYQSAKEYLAKAKDSARSDPQLKLQDANAVFNSKLNDLNAALSIH